MTAVDFAGFVDRLATVSGETILPFFRTTLGIENKGGPGTFHAVPQTLHDREVFLNQGVQHGDDILPPVLQKGGNARRQFRVHKRKDWILWDTHFYG